MPGEERRRSQRVIITVPVTLVVPGSDKPVRVSARTVAVNVHGAMVTSPRTFDADASLELVNGRTNEKVACRVTRAPRESAEGYLVPIAFTAAAPNFWQMSFPPTNCK